MVRSAARARSVPAVVVGVVIWDMVRHLPHVVGHEARAEHGAASIGHNADNVIQKGLCQPCALSVIPRGRHRAVDARYVPSNHWEGWHRTPGMLRRTCRAISVPIELKNRANRGDVGPGESAGNSAVRRRGVRPVRRDGPAVARHGRLPDQQPRDDHHDRPTSGRFRHADHDRAAGSPATSRTWMPSWSPTATTTTTASPPAATWPRSPTFHSTRYVASLMRKKDLPSVVTTSATPSTSDRCGSRSPRPTTPGRTRHPAPAPACSSPRTVAGSGSPRPTAPSGHRATPASSPTTI